MDQFQLRLSVEDEDVGQANASTSELIDYLGSQDIAVKRLKENPDTMDLGTILQFVVQSGVVGAVAQVVVAWLQVRHTAKLVVEKNEAGRILKVAVEAIDPATAERIVEQQG